MKEPKENDKRKSRIKNKLHVIYIFSNNVGHTVTKTFTTLHYRSPNNTSLHFTAFVDTSLSTI